MLIKMENKGVETVNNLDINMSIPEKGYHLFCRHHQKIVGLLFFNKCLL